MDDRVDGDFNLNQIFLSALLITAVIIGVLCYMGVKENSYYTRTQAEFFSGINLYKQGNTKQAIDKIGEAANLYPDSYQVATVYAQVLYNNNQYPEALKYMREAEQIYPGIIKNPQFLFEHAKVLLANGQYSDAKLYLQQLLKICGDPKLANQAYQVIQAIDNYQKLGGR